MNEKRAGNSQGLAWSLLIIAVLPVCYVLSAPLIYYGLLDPSNPPVWSLVYNKPYHWLEEWALLESPLHAYGKWCRRVTQH
jgi:hypothetical protein